ncbi:MAG: hypothetical protein AB1815_00280 [Bacillota bacterium]
MDWNATTRQVTIKDGGKEIGEKFYILTAAYIMYILCINILG